MDFQLRNGITIQITEPKQAQKNTYCEIKATGYHGDADYDVNNNTKVLFNDSDYAFKDLICFLCYYSEEGFESLKEEYQTLFKDEDEFESMYEDWDDFCKDYSEVHDETIELDVDYEYVIEGKKYYVEFDVFKEEV